MVLRNNAADILIYCVDEIIVTLVPVCLKLEGMHTIVKLMPQHWCGPVQVIMDLVHVVLVQAGPLRRIKCTDGILYAACRKVCFQLRLPSIKPECLC